MNDGHYPSVDIEFLVRLIESCDKIENDTTNIGNTTAYVIRGTSHIGKRTITIRKIPHHTVDYMFATGIAIKIGKIGELMKWYEENRNWKEGGYFVK